MGGICMRRKVLQVQVRHKECQCDVAKVSLRSRPNLHRSASQRPAHYPAAGLQSSGWASVQRSAHYFARDRCTVQRLPRPGLQLPGDVPSSLPPGRGGVAVRAHSPPLGRPERDGLDGRGATPGGLRARWTMETRLTRTSTTPGALPPALTARAQHLPHQDSRRGHDRHRQVAPMRVDRGVAESSVPARTSARMPPPTKEVSAKVH